MKNINPLICYCLLLFSIPSLLIPQLAIAIEDELGIDFEEEPQVEFGSETDDELDIEFDDELDIEFEENDVDTKQEPVNSNLKFRGFIDTRWGNRIHTSGDFDNQKTLFETRLQTSIRYKLNQFKFNLKADLVHDDIIDGTSIDVREAYIELPSNDLAQIRIGRQNITWGLGDLVAVNDVFPKDFLGLYYGRDAEAE